jgi:hypothetical protein
MKRFVFLLCLLASFALPRGARADDAGDAGDDASDAADQIPLACDGALCDTSNNATCDVGAVGAPARAGALLVGLALVGLAFARRRRALAAALVLAAPSVAHAAPPGPVDVAIHDEPPPRRWVAITWNPIPAFTIGKASFDVVITPVSHHALVLNPYYASTTTQPIVVLDIQGQATMRLPQQNFEGFGGELGYRYYSGLAGPRGFFVGPSFLIGAFTATAQDQSKTSYMSFGGAVDVGYEMLVADRVALALGVGAQYTVTDKTIPNQQFPASIYANNGLRPRLLLSLGVVF